MKFRALSFLLAVSLLPIFAGCDGSGPSVGPSAPAVQAESSAGGAGNLSKKEQKKRDKMGGVAPAKVD